jgi:hypothetical protein
MEIGKSVSAATKHSLLTLNLYIRSLKNNTNIVNPFSDLANPTRPASLLPGLWIWIRPDPELFACPDPDPNQIRTQVDFFPN